MYVFCWQCWNFTILSQHIHTRSDASKLLDLQFCMYVCMHNMYVWEIPEEFGVAVQLYLSFVPVFPRQRLPSWDCCFGLHTFPPASSCGAMPPGRKGSKKRRRRRILPSQVWRYWGCCFQLPVAVLCCFSKHTYINICLSRLYIYINTCKL